jgi:hypothetical protein
LSAERRVKFRYPLGLSVRFSSLSRHALFSGAGHAMNLSSEGVFVVFQHIVPEVAVPLGARVEMRIAWPTRLHGRIPLQLLAVGRIVRWGPSSFAATFRRHEFRTLKSSNLPPVIAGRSANSHPFDSPPSAIRLGLLAPAVQPSPVGDEQ